MQKCIKKGFFSNLHAYSTARMRCAKHLCDGEERALSMPTKGVAETVGRIQFVPYYGDTARSAVVSTRYSTMGSKKAQSS